MIKKLKSKIFWLIMVSISTITIGVIVLFSYYNYRNTINTSAFFIDRFYGREEREKPKGDIQNVEKQMGMENQKEFPKEERENIEIEGFYSVIIKNSQIVNNDQNITEEVKQYALEVAQKNSDTGIVGNYIYRVDRQKNDETMVMLVENENAITHVKVLIITAITISIFSIIIIYIIAKKVSETIVRPVEETFQKQVEFISDASHELKTPLAVIEANADVLENEQGKSKWLTYIQNEIESMNKLINELLLLAKMENVDNINDYEEFDLSKEAEMIVSMFESMAYEKQVKISTSIQENIKFNGQKTDVEHILSTLIDNAIKHTEEKNDIIVNLKRDKENVLIEVKNRGEEIPKEERTKIFERFYRVDKARNREEKRYGLGLAIAKSTIQKYKGVIEVDYKEGYTIFRVKLPI